MKERVTLVPLKGLEDKIGRRFRTERYIGAKLAESFERHGFQEIETPFIERRGTYGVSEEDPRRIREMFPLVIDDYGEGGELVGRDEVVLRAEGTAPVCRFLAYELARGSARLPLMVFYVTPMFRNEPIPQLGEIKKRMFYQAGVEYIGIRDIAADAEVCNIAFNGLLNLGLSPEQVKLRINDIRIFHLLMGKVGERVGADAQVEVLSRRTMTEDYETEQTSYQTAFKRAIDGISKARVEGDEEGVEVNLTNLNYAISQLELPKVLKQELQHLSELAGRRVLIKDLNLEPAESELQPVLTDLETLGSYLEKLGINYSFDFGVVRGLDIYSGGMVMQVDVSLNDGSIIAEAGGGGRYDEMVGDFLRGRFGINEVGEGVEVIEMPATGFAYGLDRVVRIAERLGLYGGDDVREVAYNIGDRPADFLLYSKTLIKALVRANALRRRGKRVLVDLERENARDAERYASNRNMDFLEV